MACTLMAFPGYTLSFFPTSLSGGGGGGVCHSHNIVLVYTDALYFVHVPRVEKRKLHGKIVVVVEQEDRTAGRDQGWRYFAAHGVGKAFPQQQRPRP